MLGKVVEVVDILRAARRWKLLLPAGTSLTGAITVFAVRTLLHRGTHRVILSFYRGVGITFAVSRMFVFCRNRRLARGAYTDSGPLLAVT